jgi:hypothetical protein
MFGPALAIALFMRMEKEEGVKECEEDGSSRRSNHASRMHLRADGINAIRVVESGNTNVNGNCSVSIILSMYCYLRMRSYEERRYIFF